MQRIVLDTNCLLASLPATSPFHAIWAAYLYGDLTLCISNEILSEYAEIIGRKTNAVVLNAVLNTIIKNENSFFIDPQYHLHLITSDPDDNKFIDCAFAAQATYIVSNDKHFNILKEIDFPKINVITISDFIKVLT
ncbi:MAG: putative toxin-antitoxin system toxin component, PIN family [Tannerella sp.]|jgi:putative PIN family toxin of toxin-antitoxin system|nr:putative toxin-antitoxin system toxin component, PIN family [Tannerella sp.]